MRIKFTNVGRNKRSWDWVFSGDLTDLTERAVIAQVKKIGQVLSNNLEFGYDKETNTGVILAGIRCVGNFTIEDLAA